MFYKKRPGEPQITFANINKIKRKLRWKPKINIEQGINMLLKDTIRRNAPVWTPLKIQKATNFGLNT